MRYAAAAALLAMVAGSIPTAAQEASPPPMTVDMQLIRLNTDLAYRRGISFNHVDLHRIVLRVREGARAPRHVRDGDTLSVDQFAALLIRERLATVQLTPKLTSPSGVEAEAFTGDLATLTHPETREQLSVRLGTSIWATPERVGSDEATLKLRVEVRTGSVSADGSFLKGTHAQAGTTVTWVRGRTGLVTSIPLTEPGRAAGRSPMLMVLARVEPAGQS